MLEVQTVYGMQGRDKRNADFIGAALEYSATLGNLPKLLLGDFNEGLDSVGTLPYRLKTAL